MEDDVLGSVSILNELDIGIEAVKSALAMIQKIEPNRTPVFLIFLVLSTGLERVLKVVLGLRKLSDDKCFLSEGDLRKYGHDIGRLKADVISKCFGELEDMSLKRKEDFAFLNENKLLNMLVLHLSGFARKDRYVHMNRAANTEATGEWLIFRWEEIENVIIPKSEAVNYCIEGRLTEYKSKVSHELVVCIEQLLAVLARTITLGKMNGQANSVGTLMYDFLFIQNADFGKKEYDLFGHTSA